jgi:hypothetical protein
MKTWSKQLRWTAAWWAILMLAQFAWGDSLQLRDGRHFDGKYVGGTDSVVAFFTQGSIDYFPVHEVLLVVFGDGNGQSFGGPLGQGSLPVAPRSGPAQWLPHLQGSPMTISPTTIKDVAVAQPRTSTSLKHRGTDSRKPPTRLPRAHPDLS